MPEVKCLVLDAIEYHNNPHLQPLMSSEATEMRGAQDVVMMISALEDATLVQYKVSKAYRLEYRANVIKYMYSGPRFLVPNLTKPYCTIPQETAHHHAANICCE